MPIRQHEQLVLTRMEKRLTYVVENATPTARKVNVLLQAYISRVKLEKFAMACDMVYITQVGEACHNDP